MTDPAPDPAPIDLLTDGELITELAKRSSGLVVLRRTEILGDPSGGHAFQPYTLGVDDIAALGMATVFIDQIRDRFRKAPRVTR